MVALLLENNADIHAKDGYKKTPLHYAAEKGKFLLMKLHNVHHLYFNRFDLGHGDIAKWLIEKGADVNLKDIGEDTPICRSVDNGNKTFNFNSNFRQTSEYR